ncbi:Gliding motility-associated ABC transporter permease protein GldF [hydrothermal vent metagenome]|uniref:Gliding motility-associated ABC transporter permease protein GldF n=1 Tax=hydrothermal vent metagenome TaxID=652676 RepID=A0A3B1AU53_9ZZZZ
MVLTIATRELRSMFLSPLAWSLLAVTQFILAWLFLVQIDIFMRLQSRLTGMENAPGLTDLVATPTLSNCAIIVLMLIPLLSMRLISEELRTGTFSLLLSAPVSITRIVLGKYLGLLGMLSIILLLTIAMPLSLLAGGSLDPGKLAAGLLGLALVLASTAAIGLFMSTLSSQPAVAAIGTYGLLLFLWLINLASGTDGEGSALFTWIATSTHFDHLLSGLVRSSDVAYFLLIIITFLSLAIKRLDAIRTSS